MPEIVDVRDWSGLDLKGANDCSSILQAAIDEAGYKLRMELGFATSKQLSIPSGRIAFGSTLYLRQNSYIAGTLGADGGSALVFIGPDSIDAIATPPGQSISYCTLVDLRVQDGRAAATGGRGLSLSGVKNGLGIRRCQVIGFPQEQAYIGAASGQSTECLDIGDLWVSSLAATAKGLLVERVDNQALLRHIKSDIGTAPSLDGYVLRIQAVANENAAISVLGIKHESRNRCPTVSLPFNTRGNLSLSSIVQRNPTGASGAGDVLQLGAAAGGSAFAVDGASKGWPTGSSSEGGGRLGMENLCGANHGDWTGARGAATVRCLGSGTAVYGPIMRAFLGSSGRVARQLAGNGEPAGVYGNVGDTYQRLDATSTQYPMWIKRQGNGSAAGWVALAQMP